MDAAIASAGEVETYRLAPLLTSIISVPVADEAAIMAGYALDSRVASVQGPVAVSKAGAPNDPLYAQQWALPKIGWDKAYAGVPASGSATIAVLDTGVDATASDLSNRLVTGQSFVNGNPGLDPNGHGTEMASIAAAQVNNGIGVAGVAYGSGIRAQSVQVLGADGTGWDGNVAAGVLWAADHGANVALMAFSSPTYSPVLAAAVSYAQSKGVVVVAATGNDGASTPTYPASLPGVIGVAATDQNDHLLASSNTGGAALAAPGANVEAESPAGGALAVTGTSASAAEVAGAAALLAAEGKGAGYIEQQVPASADPVSGQRFGRLDVYRALGPALVGTATATPSASPVATGTPVYRAASIDPFALQFNGASSQSVQMTGPATVLDLTTGTWEAWIYPTWTLGSPPGGGNPGIMGKRGPSSNQYSIHIHADYSGVDIASNGSNTTWGFTILPNTWTHLAYVQNGPSATLYVNGISQGTNSYSLNTNSVPDQPFNIGASGNGANEFFTGSID
ncbi:MAG: S8 family serine peptidase, partial [Chloroflexota bacterium]|nr:S8 family serine peptidase [Chloroflexota bacterium]